jgi:hypothetical protein
MCNTGNLNEGHLRVGPSLHCRPLGEFDRHTLQEVRNVFQSIPACSLGQTWQPWRSEAFAPCSVRVAWSGDEVLVYAELTDVDIHTKASGLNQRLWELGDSFEMFLGRETEDAYVELQVAPNNQRLQLRYESHAALERARRLNNLDAVLISGEAFRSQVWITSGEWHVFAAIPVGLVCVGQTELPGSCWRYSFSRYDYTTGNAEPVISSSSPHAQADFHRKHEWGHLYFNAP